METQTKGLRHEKSREFENQLGEDPDKWSKRGGDGCLFGPNWDTGRPHERV
jgi:hypothetical protein